MSDLIDLNGDRLVDGAGDDGIRITNIHDLSSGQAAGSINLRRSDDLTLSVGLGLSAPWRRLSGGIVQALAGMFPSSIGGGVGINLSTTGTELVDVNGDGLPDSVRRVDTGDSICPSPGFAVLLNLGGRFAEHEDCVPVSPWTDQSLDLVVASIPDMTPDISSPDKLRRTTAVSVQANVGAGFMEIFEGSVAWESSVAATAVTMVDVNGDGLPDYVRKSSKGCFNVRVNYGYGFGPEQQCVQLPSWPQDVTKPWLNSNVPGFSDLLGAASSEIDSVEANGTYSELPSVGFAFTFSVPLSPILTPWFNFTVGGDGVLKRVSGFELGLVDVDGDGLVDHVLKAESADGGHNDQVWVRLNLQGKANLLTHVDQRLHGRIHGSIDLDYDRSGNTYDQPENRWVLSKVVVHDGRGGRGLDGIVTGHDLATSYSYDGGRQDRSEREFLGFASVTRTNPDNSTIFQHWRNESFAVRGLLDREELWDASNRLFTVTQNGYTTYTVTDSWTASCERTTPFFLSPGDYCRSFFTPLEREEKRLYEGQAGPGVTPIQPGMATVQSYGYDQYGNVQDFADFGDSSNSNAHTADDLFATVVYATDSDAKRLHFVGRPTSIIVRDASNNTLRERGAHYDGLGNLKTITSSVDGSTKVDSLLDWYDDGNLKEFQGPSVKGLRHGVSYSYDDDPTRTYVTGIKDESLGYTSSARYNPLFGDPTTTTDENGNTIQRSHDGFGRLQALAGPYDSLASPTVSVSYGLDASVPYARTRNKHPETGTVDTVVLVDGLHRVIQTKKTAEVEGRGIGWSVSGQQIFDAMGRVAQQGQTVFEPGSSPLFLGDTPKNPTYFVYDVLGRKVLTREPNGDAPGALADTAVVYGFGTPATGGMQRLRAEVTDPLRNVRVMFRDVRDHVVAVQENTGKTTPTTSYLYDPLGQLRFVLDAQNHQTALEYDWLGRRTSLSNRDAGLVTFVYDAAGNLIEKHDANLRAKSVSITYDYVFDELRAIHYPFSTTVSYEYGGPGEMAEKQVGRVKQITDDAGVETRGYGKLGETARSTRTVKPLKPNGSPQTFETRFAFDSFGRMTSMLYPDGETLHYHYDAGGLVAGAWGERPATKHYQAGKETYLASLSYDEFGQRKTLVFGNGGTSRYTYDPLTRRLDYLDTGVKGRTLQNLTYSYDLVGNITGMKNALGPATGRQSGAVTYAYGYDKLYRLTDASGTALARPGVVDAFQSHFDYDDIHNMTGNRQVHTVTSAHGGDQGVAQPPQSNHDWVYQYDPARPHQATKIGDTLLAYDANGNTVRECRDHADPTCSVDHDRLRELFWNEENRLAAVVQGGGRHVTRFLYDAAGERIVKQGRGGDSITIGQFFNLKGKVAATKHVFVGETRLASKLLPPPGWNEGLTPVSTTPASGHTPAATNTNGCEPSNYQPQKCPYLPGGEPPTAYGYDDTKVRPETYYYHPDHLGSTSWVTDQNGKVHEHVEYYPYGQVWWEPRYDADGGPVKGQRFLFSSKEFDEETGLYYFGARYEDPNHARWLSVDPDMLRDATPGARRDGGATEYRAGNSGRWPIALSPFAFSNWSPATWSDSDGRSALWKAVRVAGQGIKKLFRLNRRTAKELAKKGQDIAAGSAKEAKQLAKEVSKEVGGEGKVVMHEGHALKEGGKGEPHAHPVGPDGDNYKVKGTGGPHIFHGGSILMYIFDSDQDGKIDYNDVGEWLNPLPIDMPSTALPDASSPRRGADDHT